MKLKKLSLTNFRQFSSFDLDFPDKGVFVVQGANGSGKSSILHAIQFALTGKFPSSLTKANYLKWGEEKGNAALNFEINGSDCKVRRALNTSNASLSVGSTSFRSTKAVNTNMEGLFGVSKKLVENFIFIHQGELTRLFQVKPADRAKLFHHLFGTDIYESLYNVLGLELNNHVMLPEALDKSEELENSLVAERLKLKQFESELTKNRKLNSSIDISELRNELHTLKSAKAKLDGIDTKSLEEVDSLQKELTQLDLKLKEYQENKTQTQNLIESIAASVETARNYKVEIQGLRKGHEEKVELINRLNENTKQKDYYGDLINQLNVPSLDVIAKVNATIDQQNNEINKLEDQLKPLLSGSTGQVCPTCGTEKIVIGGTEKGFETLVASIQSQLDNHKKELKELLAIKDTQAKEYQSYVQLDQQRNLYVEQLNSIETLLEQLDNLPAIDADAELKHEKVIETYNTAQEVLVSFSDSIDLTLREIETKRSRLDTLRSTKIEYDNASKLDLSQISSLEKKVESYESVQGTIIRLEENVSSIKVTIQSLENRKEKALSIEKLKESRLRYREVIKKARDIVHRNNLPIDIISSYFSHLNTHWNHTLKSLEVPFSVNLDQELNINLMFKNAIAQVDQISGGQKCCLALSFLLSIKNIFSDNINFLVLDEPTYGLDHDHIAKVGELFATLDSVAHKRDLQILVVTHESELLKYIPRSKQIIS